MLKKKKDFPGGIVGRDPPSDTEDMHSSPAAHAAKHLRLYATTCEPVLYNPQGATTAEPVLPEPMLDNKKSSLNETPAHYH